MAPDRIAGRDELAGARVLPFRGEEERAPSSALVRQALGEKRPPEAVRSALAVASALGEGGPRASPGVEEGPGGFSDLLARTGLSSGEVNAGLDALRDAGVLTGREERYRLDPDLFCILPVLSAIDWEFCRRSIESVQGRLAPALALLRELARMSGTAAEGGGTWLHPSIQDLTDETLYGRTAVTQALGELTRAGLVVRTEQPARRGLRIRLNPGALGRRQSSAGEAADAAPSHRRAEAPSSVGVTVQIGGAEIGVPAGSRLRLPSGMDYRLEIGPDGGAIIRIDD